MSKQKRVGVIGHFGFGKNLLNGQTIKTKIITNELEKELGKNEVVKIDTHGGIKSYLKLPFQLFGLLRKCRNIIILPAHRGLRVITPILNFWNKFFKRKLHYCVIGGWLPDVLKSKKKLAKRLKKFDGIYVETNTMKTALEAQGFTNVIVMPNCKNLHILDESELVYNTEEPFKLCTFSRVIKEKGIEDAVEAVKKVNETNGRVIYKLDIYGQIDSNQIQWFDDLKKSFPEYIKYCGIVPFDKSVVVLKDYFALLFPTRFYTEGVPGTIIDSYAAGVPVVSSIWESFSDVIDNKITGIGYSFNDISSLIKELTNIAIEPQIINDMKLACVNRAKEFTPETSISILKKKL